MSNGKEVRESEKVTIQLDHVVSDGNNRKHRTERVLVCCILFHGNIIHTWRSVLFLLQGIT